MKYRREDDTVIVTDKDLAGFSRSKRNTLDPSAGFEKTFFDITSVKDENKKVTARASGMKGTPSVEIEATADFVTDDGGDVFVGVSVSKKKLPMRFTAYYYPELLARAVINGYVYALAHSLDRIKIRIAFVHGNDGDCVVFEKTEDVVRLGMMTNGIISRAMPFLSAFAEREGTVREELSRMQFPYKNVRSGQEQLMIRVMKTMRRGGKLLSSAPTGTGKTMATLYPSLKALAERYIDRIFYVTSKGTTGKAAYDAMKMIGMSAPHARTVMIYSKEKCCGESKNEMKCDGCPKISECLYNDSVISYEQRRDCALEMLLGGTYMYDIGNITEAAQKYNVCAYELSLDLSEYCDVIICDLNYVFDSRIRFYRYFKAERGEKYAFLIDEAHNLPDRIRSTYSADIAADDLADIAGLVLDETVVDDELSQLLAKCAEQFRTLKKAAQENAEEKIVNGRPHIVGYEKMREIPSDFSDAVEALGKYCYAKAKESDELTPLFDALYRKISDFLLSRDFFGEGFSFAVSLFDEDVKCSSVCLDPSDIITKMCSSAHGTVLFSATLSPGEYFSDAFGYKGSIFEAESPFDPGNLCVTVYDGVSTRLSDRKSTVAEVSEIIYTVISSMPGNYLVYFPSYAYMKMTARELLGEYPEIRAVMQREGMSYKEKEKFLSAFSSRKYDSLLGMCVLGGVFSEGVDLVGDSLIGVIVVGSGLSGMSSELNMMSEYYEEKYEKGYEYSYLYPAINKIEQAAGRVIRDADDRGCVVLIDDRLKDPALVKIFPKMWQPVKCTSDPASLATILERFWNRHPPNE